MTCRICKRVQAPPDHKAHPFCSHRCQMIDLGRWLGEEYRIPVDEGEDEDGRAPHSTSPET